MLKFNILGTAKLSRGEIPSSDGIIYQLQLSSWETAQWNRLNLSEWARDRILPEFSACHSNFHPKLLKFAEVTDAENHVVLCHSLAAPPNPCWTWWTLFHIPASPFAEPLGFEKHFRIWPSTEWAWLPPRPCVWELLFYSCLECGQFIRSPHTLSLQESLHFFVSFAVNCA